MKKNYPSLTLSHLQKLCRKGEIRVDGHRTTATAPLSEGMEIKLPPYIIEYSSIKKRKCHITVISKFKKE